MDTEYYSLTSEKFELIEDWLNDDGFKMGYLYDWDIQELKDIIYSGMIGYCEEQRIWLNEIRRNWIKYKYRKRVLG